MKTTRLSTKGQIIIPRALCKAHRWQPGMEFAVEETKDGVLLRPLKPFPPTKIKEVLGCAGYTGPRKTLKDMEGAIARGARERRR